MSLTLLALGVLLALGGFAGGLVVGYALGREDQWPPPV